MPFYEWNPETLSVQVQEMDREHQILIEKMNKVYDTHAAKAPVAEIDKALMDLVNYTVSHFSDEEAFMEKINFEGIATHRIIHKQLLGEVTKHVDAFKQSGALSDSFFNFLGVWLTSHIRGIDIKYSAAAKKSVAPKVS